ncbi:TPA: ankyrin repeat domain-containing protein [Burkholderia lata]
MGKSLKAPRSNPDDDLVTACANMDPDGVRAALKAGANPNVERESWLDTLLVEVYCNGYRDGAASLEAQALEIIKELIDAGADMNAVKKVSLDGPILGEAAAFGHLDVMKVLLDAGADVEGVAPGGYETPLLSAALAAAYPRADQAMRMLIDAGADVNARRNDPYGGAVHRVISAEADAAPQMLQMLIDAGVDLTVVGHWDLTAREYAREQGYTGAVGGRPNLVALIEQGVIVQEQGALREAVAEAVGNDQPRARRRL